jgi:hypothetical protein
MTNTKDRISSLQDELPYVCYEDGYPRATCNGGNTIYCDQECKLTCDEMVALKRTEGEDE